MGNSKRADASVFAARRSEKAQRLCTSIHARLRKKRGENGNLPHLTHTIDFHFMIYSSGSLRAARLHQRMGYIWFDFRTTRDRSSFLFLGRATRLRRELYEVLGVCRYTWLARLHGGSSVTQMNLEAPSWIADFRFSAALDLNFYLDFSWTLWGGLLLFDAFRVSRSVFFLLGMYVPGLFLLGWVGDGLSAFCAAYPPAQCRGWSG